MEETITPVEKTGTSVMVRMAKILSALTTPFIIPTIAFLLLFFCTYIRILPIAYKAIVLSLVFVFTFLLPMLVILLFQKANGWGIRELGERKKRFIPYILTIMSYTTCLITMNRLHLPRYMTGIIVSSLICMVLCTMINFKWKISTHVASSGLFVGGLLSYSLIFHFNPTNTLCIFILLAGMVGTARIIVKQHTLSDVFTGFVVGFLCGIIGILFI
jgi:membrane-associated phospholipid phosphatase